MLVSLLVSFALQDSLPERLQLPDRPMVECSEHMNDDRAMDNCLSDLLDNAEDALDDALESARAEAREIDLDLPGISDATQMLESAHNAWMAYRDAECARRASLLLIGDSADDVATDCQISLTRARVSELLTQ